MTQAGAAPATGAPKRLSAWLARLGPLAVERPSPSLEVAAAGVGGALVAAGVIAIGGDRWASTGSSAQALVLTAALLAGAMAAMARTPAPLAVAGVSASGLAAPALAFFVTAGGGFPSLRDVAILGGLLVAGLYLLGPWKGHTFHLGVLVAAGWVLGLTFGDFGIDRTTSGFSTIGDTVSGAGAASMVVGVAYLGFGSWLHDEGLRGMATPFLAVAVLALPLGALAVLRDTDDVLQSVVMVVIGGAIALVGGRSRRRGGIWIGIAIAGVGLGALATGITDSDPIAGLLMAAAGAGLVFAAPRVDAIAGQPPSTAPPLTPGSQEPTDGPTTAVRRRRRPPEPPPADPEGP